MKKTVILTIITLIPLFSCAQLIEDECWNIAEQSTHIDFYPNSNPLAIKPNISLSISYINTSEQLYFVFLDSDKGNSYVKINKCKGTKVFIQNGIDENGFKKVKSSKGGCKLIFL